jgi:serine/threonine protein kinase
MNPISDRTLSHLQKVISEPDLSNTKYSLIQKIGSGGMAEVYLVFDNELERKAALKVIHPEHSSADFCMRMMREAKIIAQIEHPAIVPVHDVGELPDGRIFYVMKYVQGELLDSHAAKIPEISDRLRIAQKICDAVSFAHSCGVIHRDLKPQNIMVGAFGEVQVMDWGLAKALSQKIDDTGSRHATNTLDFKTDAGTLMGTPGYIAPEQGNSEKTDIYALGGILYYLLICHHPEKEIFSRHLDHSVPRRLEAICKKAMSENPEARYASVTELSGDINAYLNGFSLIAYRENIFEKFGRWCSRHSFVLLLIAAYLLMRVLLFLFSGRAHQ